MSYQECTQHSKTPILGGLFIKDTLSSTHLISLSLQQMVRSLLASSSMTLVSLVSVVRVVNVVRAAMIVIIISATLNVSINVI